MNSYQAVALTVWHMTSSSCYNLTPIWNCSLIWLSFELHALRQSRPCYCIVRWIHTVSCRYKLLHELSLLASIVFVASCHCSPENVVEKKCDWCNYHVIIVENVWCDCIASTVLVCDLWLHSMWVGKWVNEIYKCSQCQQMPRYSAAFFLLNCLTI